MDVKDLVEIAVSYHLDKGYSIKEAIEKVKEIRSEYNAN